MPKASLVSQLGQIQKNPIESETLPRLNAAKYMYISSSVNRIYTSVYFLVIYEFHLTEALKSPLGFSLYPLPRSHHNLYTNINANIKKILSWLRNLSSKRCTYN